MAETTKIEWTDATWNPITGCTLVSEGCRHCYAARLAATRLRHLPSRKGLARMNLAGEAKFTGEVRLNEDWLHQPLCWRRPRRVFVCAHGDLFHEAVPDKWIDDVFTVMAWAPQHTFQVLTKRPERAREYLSSIGTRQANLKAPASLDGALFPLPNVWLGTSVEDQATADARIPHLLATPAAVRFVSAEPLLGPVDLLPYLFIVTHADDAALDAGSEDPLPFNDPATTNPTDVATPRLDWIIAGGESGLGARPMHPDWARGLRDQCQAAGAPFFFKQWGEWAPSTQSEALGNPRSGWKSRLGYPAVPSAEDLLPSAGASFMEHKGKSAAGRLLDGREWSEMPKVAR